MTALSENSLLVINDLVRRYPMLAPLRDDLIHATCLLYECYRNGNKILTCGNGGSAADSEHIVGELMKSFLIKRAPDPAFGERAFDLLGDGAGPLMEGLEGAIPAISLVGHPALQSAYLNDVDGAFGFAQQLYGLGNEGDVLIAISTSGNSRNVVLAAQVARVKGIAVVALTGERDSRLSELSDVALKAPASKTHEIQELHLPIYHALCAALEAEVFGVR